MSDNEQRCHDLKKRLGSVKFHGTFLLIYTVVFIITMCIVLVTTPPQHDVKMSNETCKPFHRFPLTEELYVTVCAERNPVLLQINQFENGEPSHRGVFLTKTQWLYLRRTELHIEKSIIDVERILN